MFTLVIGKDSVGKMSYVAQHIKDKYSENTIFILDRIGELTEILHEEGLHITTQINEAEIIVADGINERIKDYHLKEKLHVFFISYGNDLNKEFVKKAYKIILFPVNDPQKMSEILDIPVDYLKGLKPYQPITVI